MAALPVDASNASEASTTNDNKQIDYSKLDPTKETDQDTLSQHIKNYDVDHMNWTQIEYDAMYEGNILFTHQVIQDWMNKNESKSKSDSNDTNNAEYQAYVEEKKKHMKLISNINKHYQSLQTGFEQLFPNETTTKANDNSKSDEKTSDKKNKSEDGWITQVDNYKGISVLYRKEKDNPIHSIKVQFKCKCSPLEFLATINEFDLIVCIFILSFYFVMLA